MSFKIENKQMSNKQVKWKFETSDRIFTSDVERFKRNVQFWKSKLMIDDTVQVEILEGIQWLQDHLTEEKNIVDVEHEEIQDDSLLVEMSEEFNQLLETLENDEPIIDSTPIESDGNESDPQPSVPEDTTDIIDTPKPKARKKTS
tara:strand:+ start:304 stop:738 length:435 start_codon:yes stop_codon:yes gene_type:complete